MQVNIITPKVVFRCFQLINFQKKFKMFCSNKQHLARAKLPREFIKKKSDRLVNVEKSYAKKTKSSNLYDRHCIYLNFIGNLML